MVKELITICISNHNTSDFILNSLYCLEKLTKNKYKVIIRDNDSEIKDYLKLKKNIKYFKRVELYRVENLNFPYRLASLAHGTSINDLILKIETKYGAILDSDFTFLFKNWDEVLINEINEEYPIIGTQAPSFKYQDFPFVFGFFFDSKILKSLNIDFRPKDIFGKGQDTGFEMRKKFLDNGYKGKLLVNKYTQDYKFGPFKALLCQEFYLQGHNEIFASHFWRGTIMGTWKYYRGWMKWIGKIPIIGHYLLKYIFTHEFLNKIVKFKGKKEKNKWMQICREIIKNHSQNE